MKRQPKPVCHRERRRLRRAPAPIRVRSWQRRPAKEPTTLHSMKTTVLLADADLSARQALAGFLENEGFSILLAEGASDTLDLIQAQDVGMVILGTDLRDCSGWEAFARVATMNPQVPAIVMTSESGQKARGAEAGVDAVFEKPIEFDELLRIIRELLAQPTEMRLQRVCTVEALARYVPRSYRTFVRALQDRYSAPLAMPELDQILARCVPTFIGKSGTTSKLPHAEGVTDVASV